MYHVYSETHMLMDRESTGNKRPRQTGPWGTSVKRECNFASLCVWRCLKQIYGSWSWSTLQACLLHICHIEPLPVIHQLRLHMLREAHTPTNFKNRWNMKAHPFVTSIVSETWFANNTPLVPGHKQTGNDQMPRLCCPNSLGQCGSSGCRGRLV